MATITYGKGKTLRPTPLAALEETIARNSRKGRVEMLDMSTQPKVKTTVEAGVPVQPDHVGVLAAKNLVTHLQQGGGPPARVKAAGESKRQRQAAEENKEVRVRIHAPKVVAFFTSKKRDELLVTSDESQAK